MCVDKHQLHHENHELLFFLVLSLSKLRCCFSSNLSLFPNLFSDRPSFPQLPWSPGHFPGEMPGDRYMCSLWSFLPCTPGATWGNPPAVLRNAPRSFTRLFSPAWNPLLAARAPRRGGETSPPRVDRAGGLRRRPEHLAQEGGRTEWLGPPRGTERGRKTERAVTERGCWTTVECPVSDHERPWGLSCFVIRSFQKNSGCSGFCLLKCMARNPRGWVEVSSSSLARPTDYAIPAPSNQVPKFEGG